MCRDSGMLREFFLTTSEVADWQRLLPASRNVFGSHGYAQICERFHGITPRLHALEKDSGSVSNPMFLRTLATLDFAMGVDAKWDAATPDYTGPITVGDCVDLYDKFTSCHEALMIREKIVAEFAHLHPWAANKDLLGHGCSYDRDIVWIDLKPLPEETFRQQFEHSCRKNIQKAVREGVTVFTASDDWHIEEFFRIYTSTMQRNQALDRYAMSLEYFKSFREKLPDHSRFVFARLKDRIVAATLYLHDDTDIYSFLGGADALYSECRPTNLVIWETLRWAHEQKKLRFVLGGGYGLNDGILRFKSSFSRNRQSFYTFRRIHLREEFNELDRRFRVEQGIGEQRVEYFPSYRSA